MENAKSVIQLIRDSKFNEALKLLNSSPELATQRFDEKGQLNGATPLHWAAHRNAEELCQLLIDLGADVNDSATQWWLTPLSWAADAGSAEAVELLLQNGAEVDQDVVVGLTALHAVAMGGSSRGARDPESYKRTAEILIAHGADINKPTDREQRTPLDEALKSGNKGVEEVLRTHGAKTSK